MSEQDRFVGELMQPGGIRALERLGLDQCAKTGIDSVQVRLIFSFLLCDRLAAYDHREIRPGTSLRYIAHQCLA
jgi:hypothetical protein